MMSPIYTDKYDGSRIDYGAQYGQTLNVTFTFIKDDYSDISMTEQRNILKWLGGYKKNSWLTLYDYDYSEICQLYGRFINIQAKTADSKVIGYIGEFECPTPFAYSPLREVEQIYTGKQQLTLENESDAEDIYVYPIVTITPMNGPIDELHLFNKDIQETTVFKNIKADEIITINSSNKIVCSNNEYRYIGTDFSGLYGENEEYTSIAPVWPKLQPGDNRFIIDPCNNTAQVKYNFKYRYPMKIGTVIDGVI